METFFYRRISQNNKATALAVKIVTNLCFIGAIPKVEIRQIDIMEMEPVANAMKLIRQTDRREGMPSRKFIFFLPVIYLIPRPKGQTVNVLFHL